LVLARLATTHLGGTATPQMSTPNRPFKSMIPVL